MNTAAPTIVLDTNVLIASIGRKSPFRWIFDCVVSGKIILCISNDILFEYQEVIGRKTNEQIAESIVNFLSVTPFVEKVEIYFSFDLIKADPSDNKFVDCAITANADYLVSNDKHFQVLQNIDFPKVNTLTLNEFSDLHQRM